ncbi:MAG: GAF domain-containing protein [Crocinitomicaceae bacterium]|nr:GAF domain-containing protein [Crocinitomicaceae bacterium]MDG1349841.1 GAF domain-containing protein [Crocinitomicaceae bacterium]MDG1734664.1 GAF domain-containing protein [Crocinitomicaceae bacterium]MDG2505605.1 GAF domain-containing protein [Crocinitomicaceae bacterium]
MDKFDKEANYIKIEAILFSLISKRDALVSSLANFVAVLKSQFDFFWVGFYLVDDNKLVLGPFQGPLACTEIKFGKGVCGSAWSECKTIVVGDVHQFPGHIACSSETNSEIVLPVINAEGKVVAVLDIDSITFNDFDAVDQKYLEKLLKWFASQVY